jgi:CheY-like chemotaxis protein
MLTFARRQELKLEPVDLPALVRGMLSFLQRSIGPSVRIETRFPRGLRRVRSDANQLETALLNLAVNARDAMAEGGVVTIGARAEHVEPGHSTLEPGAYVALSVSDTGAGMDAATLTRATEPFFTTKGVGKGTGLGLSMVHGLADQSGGQLLLFSRPGQGTTVEVWLRDAGAAPEPATCGGDEDHLVILAVDDDPLVLTNTAALLEDLGHHVIQAASGGEALEALKRYPDLDMVVTDHVMPGMTGLQVKEAVQTLRPDLPVLIVTGFADLPDRTSAETPRLLKPFTQNELGMALQAVLENPRQALRQPARRFPSAATKH